MKFFYRILRWMNSVEVSANDPLNHQDLKAMDMRQLADLVIPPEETEHVSTTQKEKNREFGNIGG